MKKYKCLDCSYVYKEAKGDKSQGIAPGTAFDDLPSDWVCPVCESSVDSFVEV